jgi:glutathione S-transferase
VAEWVPVERARSLPGLRLALTVGVPGPWDEAAKAIFRVKGIPFARVPQRPGGDNAALRAWTGHDNAPVAVWEDEAPRTRWDEILWLAERIAPDPPLVPDEAMARALVFGLGRELCGELGFGWCRRLGMVHGLLAAAPELPIGRYLAERYGYSPEVAAAAPGRAAGILRLFSDRWAAQRARGSRYLVGDALSALDLWWAAFAALVEPLPAELCPMSEPMRRAYQVRDPVLREAVDPALLAHRDAIYREYLELPIEL